MTSKFVIDNFVCQCYYQGDKKSCHPVLRCRISRRPGRIGTLGKEVIMPLYNRLKEHRARLGVNQAELGNMAGVSRQTISLIERGDYSPSVTLALKLAAICGTTEEDIFRNEE